MVNQFTMQLNKIKVNWDSYSLRGAKSCVHCNKKTKGRATSKSLHDTNLPVPACAGCTINSVVIKGLVK